MKPIANYQLLIAIRFFLVLFWSSKKVRKKKKTHRVRGVKHTNSVWTKISYDDDFNFDDDYDYNYDYNYSDGFWLWLWRWLLAMAFGYGYGYDGYGYNYVVTIIIIKLYKKLRRVSGVL